jgi:hypothetical protein
VKLPRLAILLPILATTVLHAAGAPGGLLSDDFSHLHWIHQAASQNALGSWVLATFTQPLPSGNYAYRPAVFASYALDYLAFGAHPLGWHATNLIIHVGVALLAGLWVERLARNCAHPQPQLAGWFATSLIALTPLAGESTWWPVGRFDLLAAFFSMLFLLLGAAAAHGATPVAAGARARRTFAPQAAMAASLLLALLSKESALPILLVGVALSVASASGNGRNVRQTVSLVLRTHALSAAVLAAYLAWRWTLFASILKVYPASQPPASIGEAWQRIATLAHAPGALYGAASPWLVGGAGLALALLLRTFAVGTQRQSRDRRLPAVLLGCGIAYALAPATSFPILGTNGEGTRNLYIAWTLLAAGIAWCAACQTRTQAVGAVMLALTAVGHVIAVGVWQSASAHMRSVTVAVAPFAAAQDASKFALLLLPDHLGPAPFLRNAQGGIVMPPTQARDWSARLVGMTPMQFDEWAQHLQTDTVSRLRQQPFDRRDFAGLVCWVPTSGTLLRLTTAFNADGARWRSSALAEAQQRGCLQ